MENFDIIDTDDAAEEEARKIAERRMFMYSEAALVAADEVDRKYVVFPDLKQVLTAFDRAYQLALRPTRPQGILLSGPPGSSKTSVSSYFCKSLPSSASTVDGHAALYVRLRSNPCAGSIVSMLLRVVKHPFTRVTSDRFDSMRDIAFEALVQLGTRLIFVDQAHVLSQNARKPTRTAKGVVETTASEVLRDLMDETGIALVFLASDRLSGLDHIDESLADRVTARLRLRHFEDDGAWQQFLTQIGSSVSSVDLTVLAEPNIARLTHQAVLGNRRRTKHLLTEVVLVAIDAGAKAVDQTHLKLAFDRVSGVSSEVVNPYAVA